MTATLPSDVWVPVPLRARHIMAWDMIVGNDGSLWAVSSSASDPSGKWSISALCGAEGLSQFVDPDDVIPVLVPVVERDAVELTRDQLGARLVERRMERE